MDEAGDWAIARASTGDIGKQMVAQPHRLRVGGESMVGWVCAHREPRIALDVGADAVHFDNPLLHDTRSELVMPLQVAERMIGAMDVQSTQASAFDADDVRSLQGMADLVAIVLQNARTFTATRNTAERQRFAVGVVQRFQRAESIDDVVSIALQELGTSFDLSRAALCISSGSTSPGSGNGRETTPTPVSQEKQEV
jgi:GAF domain-containing protein